MNLLQKKLLCITLFILFSFSCLNSFAQKLTAKNLTVEYQKNPLSIDNIAPRFSWKVSAGTRNTLQSGYELRVGLDSTKLGAGQQVAWATGFRKTDQSIHINYEGPELRSNSRYYWQVRVKDNHGNTSPWSEINFWELGLKSSEWTAKWITADVKDTLAASPFFRKQLRLVKPVRRAIAYITADGLYEAHINGKKVGDSYFTPGWTSYKKRLQYQVYDVSGLLKKGYNVLGVILGDGWFKGHIGFGNQQDFYGNTRSLLLQVEIEYRDGTRETLKTDESWKYQYGAILSSDIYNGEIYDSRLEKKNWTKPGFKEDSSWKNVRTLNQDMVHLVSTVSPPVKKHEYFKPVRILKTPKGETVVDFGQNLVGWVQMKATGASGTKITISHAEVLDKEGNFYTQNLRSAKQRNIYTLNGDAQQIFEPHFTFQGFRYVKLEGYPGKIDPSSLTAIAIYSDMKLNGAFTTSDTLLNKLQHNILWGQKGNFVDVPTDCPQRDERLGWTGDAQAFYSTAAFNMDVAGFFTKWLKDLKADQLENGLVPHVIPNVMQKDWGASTGWADVSTIIPWGMYQSYGDSRILEQQYGSMKLWVDFMISQSKDNLWNTGSHFGDWLFYRPNDDNDGRSAITDKHLIAQTFFAHSTQLLINTANILGKKEEAKYYADLLLKIKSAFQKEYMTTSGRLVSSTQTAYVLALEFDVLPEEFRAQAAMRLVKNIEEYGNHLTTGFLGTPYLCHVLSRFGFTDIAYKLLLQQSYPSWLYPVKMGATTIWERWDGIKEDGSFQNDSMNSFNHYAYGAIGDWMYKVMAGINIDDSAPGYKKIKIAPQPGGKITQVGGQLDSPYGLIGSDWSISNGQFRIKVVIPPNTTASLKLPAAALVNVTESGKAVSEVKELSEIRKTGNDLEIKAGSGTYLFQYDYKM